MNKLLFALLLTAGSVTAQVLPPSNRINGEVPPMTPTLAASQRLEMKQTVGNGFILITHQTYRARGTRAPIHTHPYGGQTCVIKGEMTLYMDGATPARKVAGECYWMPPNRRMTGVNTGKSEAVMFDTFLVPDEKDIWIIVEPNLPFNVNTKNANRHLH